jgi:hypothetical protein
MLSCHQIVTSIYLFGNKKSPNGLRMSRLADLAGYLPLTIVLGFKDVDLANEDTKPKAKSA